MQLSWVYHIACHWGVDMQLCSSSHEGKSCELQVYCFLSSVCSNAILLSYTEEYFQLILWPSDWAYFTIAKCPSSKQLVWQLCFWSAAFRIHITFLQTWCYYLQAAHGVQSLSLLMWAGCFFFLSRHRSFKSTSVSSVPNLTIKVEETFWSLCSCLLDKTHGIDTFRLSFCWFKIPLEHPNFLRQLYIHLDYTKMGNPSAGRLLSNELRHEKRDQTQLFFEIEVWLNNILWTFKKLGQKIAWRNSTPKLSYGFLNVRQSTRISRD